MYKEPRERTVPTLDQIRGLVLAHCLEGFFLHCAFPLGRYTEQVDRAGNQGDDRGQDCEICAGGHVVEYTLFVQGFCQDLPADVLVGAVLLELVGDD
jgi:hypothetical protein